MSVYMNVCVFAWRETRNYRVPSSEPTLHYSPSQILVRKAFSTWEDFYLLYTTANFLTLCHYQFVGECRCLESNDARCSQG